MLTYKMKKLRHKGFNNFLTIIIRKLDSKAFGISTSIVLLGQSLDVERQKLSEGEQREEEMEEPACWLTAGPMARMVFWREKCEGRGRPQGWSPQCDRSHRVTGKQLLGKALE